MATLIKVKDATKSNLKKFAIKKFGEEIGNDITYDTIISLILKEAETKGFDITRLVKTIERGIK